MAEIIRRRFSTLAALRTFWEECGPFQYVLEGTDDDELLSAGEWLFADDLNALLKALLQWQARGVRMCYVFDAEGEGQRARGYWMARHLPEPLVHLPAMDGLLGKDASPCEAELAYLRCLVSEIGAHGYLLFSQGRGPDLDFGIYLQYWESQGTASILPFPGSTATAE